MKTIYIDEDEYYPFYTFYTENKHWSIEAEFSEDEIENFNRVFKEFYEMQSKLRMAYDKKVSE